MKKVLAVFGFGPGVSTATAERFGAEGFAVALVSRTRQRVESGVAALAGKGIEAAAFVADVRQPEQVARVLAEIRSRLAAPAALLWTAYSSAAGDLLAAAPDAVRGVLDVPVTGLVAAVRAALPGLQQSGNGAVLISNGSLGYFDPAVDEMAVTWNVMGLAVANAAKHKLAGLLARKLKPQGVFVGEVIIQGIVKGSAFDSGNGTLEAATVANAFWRLYTARESHFATLG